MSAGPADPPLCSTGIGLETPTEPLSIAARGNDNAQDKDKADRARAARRYRSRLALAEAYPPLAEYCRERFAENNVFTVGRATLISDLQKYTPQILSAYPAVQMIKTLTLHFGGKARALFKVRSEQSLITRRHANLAQGPRVCKHLPSHTLPCASLSERSRPAAGVPRPTMPSCQRW